MEDKIVYQIVAEPLKQNPVSISVALEVLQVLEQFHYIYVFLLGKPIICMRVQKGLMVGQMVRSGVYIGPPLTIPSLTGLLVTIGLLVTMQDKSISGRPPRLTGLVNSLQFLNCHARSLAR